MDTPKRILYVEDDDLLREVAQRTLRGAGYDVVAVADGEAALAALPASRPDLILSDVRMPGISGFELLERIRRDPTWHQIPFIIVSAKVDTADIRMGMSLGADDYVTKPVEPGDLLKTIGVRLSRAAVIADTIEQQKRFLMQTLPHELRTPLTGVLGLGELIRTTGEAGETLSPAELADYGRNLERSGKRLLGIVEDFTLWAYFESLRGGADAGTEPEIRWCEVSGADVAHTCRECAQDYGRPADLQLQVVSARVWMPRNGFPQVVRHLVHNAMKFSLPGTGVTVGSRIAGDRYALEVADLGRGMSAEQRQQIGALRQFDRHRFEQQGVGMGLALTASLARLTGGSLALEPNPAGRGLVVRLALRLDGSLEPRQSNR